MGSGTRAAAEAGAPLHAGVIDDFKDQLLIVMIRRLADQDGKLDIKLDEIDGTGKYLINFSVDMETQTFHFQWTHKQ